MRSCVVCVSHVVAKVKFAAQSERELHHALLERDAESAQIADRFLSEIDEALEQLELWPESGRPLDHMPLRKLRIGRSQYALLYDILDTTVRVIRVVHLRSDPESWTE